MTETQKKALMSSDKDNWETPQWLFDKYDSIYHFTLDAASSDKNAKTEKYYTAKENGLVQPWEGVVWRNPPYGKGIGKWVQKAYEESRNGSTVVCLLPARTDTAWFHDYCTKGKIEFLRRRIRFSGSNYDAPFPSMVVIFECEKA